MAVDQLLLRYAGCIWVGVHSSWARPSKKRALGYWGLWRCVLLEVIGRGFDRDILVVALSFRAYAGSYKGPGIRGQLI